MSARLEQEKYMTAIVNTTPIASMHPRASAFSAMSDSTLSINSLILTAGSNDAFPSTTPEFGRRTHNPFHKAMNSLRASGGRNTKRKILRNGRCSFQPRRPLAHVFIRFFIHFVVEFSRWGSMKDKQHGSQTSLASEIGYNSAWMYHGMQRSDGADIDVPSVHALPRAAFYIFGEKGQIKVSTEHIFTFFLKK